MRSDRKLIDIWSVIWGDIKLQTPAVNLVASGRVGVVV